MLMHMGKRGKMEKTYNMISKHRNIVYAFGILSVLYFHFLCIRKEAGFSLGVFDCFFDLYISSIGVEMFVFLSCGFSFHWLLVSFNAHRAYFGSF